MSTCCSQPDTSFAFESPDAALHALCNKLSTVETETINWTQAIGRVLAEDITSDRPSPACNVSAMDGYAIMLADVQSSEFAGMLPLATTEVAIGRQPPAGQPGMAMKIVTGAPVPAMADCVIKREDVIEQADSIVLDQACVASCTQGQNIRKQGENLAADEAIATLGRCITAPIAAACASFGRMQLRVYRTVRLGIITTGNEVIEPTESPTPWQLRDANGPALLAMCQRYPWITISSQVHTHDTLEAVTEAARNMLASCDALVLTGGVSMGDYDFVPAAVEALGAETVFHKLPQRPGKPALGAALDGKPIIGLPGNPLAVLVGALRLVLPAIAVRGGLHEPIVQPAMVQLVNPDTKTLPLYWRRMVRRIDAQKVELISSHGSGDVPSAAIADGFIELPPGQRGEGPWPFWSWR